MKLFGTWGELDEPIWKKYLDDAPNSIVVETGLSRDELEKILDILYEHRIIN